MKKLVASVAVASTLGLGAAIALQNSGQFELRSRNNSRVSRRVDTTGGVRLIREFRGDCRRNVGWGFTRNEVWVDRGCQALFEIGSARWRDRDDDRDDRNDDWRNRDWRNDDWRRGDVWRDDRDDQNPGWGTNGRGNNNNGNGWGRGGRWGNGRNDRDDRNDRRNGTREVRLASFNDDRRSVRLYDAQSVRLQRELSRGQCGRNDWGWDRDELWVDNGCSAIFEVRERGRNNGGFGDGAWDDRPWDDGNRFTLTSRNEGRFERRVDNRGVRLVRELSRNRCREGRTWGADTRRVWVDQGCSAIFEVLPR